MKNKKLLISVTKKDLIIQTFRAGGKGGQHQNKTDSGVRIIHKESGAVGESREFRSQYQNKKQALRRLAYHPKFQLWLQEKLYEQQHKQSIEDKVNEMMKPENLKIEVKKDGKWIEWKENNNEN